MNQDGRTPGMTVPSQEAQEALLRQACRDAGVVAGDDPVRRGPRHRHARSAIRSRPGPWDGCLSEGRPADRPCLIGSVKTNIGHLEAGAGIAGLIKAALALHHRRIPGNLHFDRPNPEIDFDALRLRVPTRCEPWPAGDGPALAGVNSFGFGGTNAHVVLQECRRDGRRVAGRPASSGTGRVRKLGTAVPGSSPCRPAVPRRCARRPGRWEEFAGAAARTTSRSTRSPPTPRSAAPITITAWRSSPTRSRSWRSACGTSPTGGRRPGVVGGTGVGRPSAAAGLRLLGAGAAVVGDGPATAARGAGLPRRDRALRRDRATARRLVAARRADRRRVRARAWTSPRSRSPASSRCRWRWPSCGPPGACGPRPWSGTASARWRPPTSPGCSAWKTRSASSTTAAAAWSWRPSAAGCSPPACRPTRPGD